MFRQHAQSVDAFLDALRIEKARTLRTAARARLVELAPLIAKSAELEVHRTVSSLTKVAESSSVMGLMDLLGFEKDFEKDAEELSASICLLAGRGRRETREVSVDREVEEAYDAQETVAGFFRNKIVTVRKTRSVRRSNREQQYVSVNGFGEYVDGWILVRPGTFAMGQANWYSRELHDVTITRPFLMLATPITQARWETLMGKNPSAGPQTADHPVNNVSWFDAIAYCNALSRSEGLEEAYIVDSGTSVRWKGLDALGYRVPTEAEWEYACRAGTTGDRYGDVNAIAWWEGNSGKMIHQVGQKLPNPWGFFDMLGNVFEWCWDKWVDNYPDGDAVDPVGPEDGDDRVHRGGRYYGGADYAQAWHRGSWKPDDEALLNGFRPVKSCPIPRPDGQIER